ncbi:LysR family transcriptional regulator [Cereibacter sphaeroides]|nr:LysR family transcriptional regulator [Cereibacter sphaeroides]
MGKDDEQGPEGHARGIRALSLRQIEVFHAVYSTRSISGASRLLNVSQPTLSRTLRRIEDVLSIALFRRSATGLMPTIEAQLIHAEVDGLMRRLDGLGARIRDIASGGAVPFRLGATASVARGLVPRALSEIARAAPESELFLDVLPVDQIAEYLVAGTGQCVITMAPVDHPMLVSAVLGQGALVAVVPAKHPLARRPVLEPGDLEGVDMITFQVDGPHQQAIRAFLQPAGVIPRSRAVVRFADTAIALAAEGLGVALVDTFTTMAPLGERVVKLPLAHAPRFDVQAQWNPGHPSSDHFRQFRQVLETLLRQQESALDMP